MSESIDKGKLVITLKGKEVYHFQPVEFAGTRLTDAKQLLQVNAILELAQRQVKEQLEVMSFL